MTTRESESFERGLRRREAILALGGLGTTALAWPLTGRAGAMARTATVDGQATAAAACVLSREATEGPYWISNHLTRRDITENRPGVPLSLHMTVVHATTCAPIANADVEVWHADAGGVYSGFSSGAGPAGGPAGRSAVDNASRFLRGHLRSDGNGLVVFRTIYPGWYRGRTPHIHLKVHVGGNVVHTGQVFFRDATSTAVYRTSAYRSRGLPDTTNAQDGIFRQADGTAAMLDLTKRSGGGYVGAIALGVKA